jgi:phosphoglycerate dehydrogenase-like enzyme
MAPFEILVLGAAGAPHYAPFQKLHPEARVTIGNRADDVAAAAARAEIVVLGGNYRELFRELWPTMERLRWVHALQAGLETLLFPELVESAVPLTNSRGVFARSLGEFALAGMLSFAKDLERMRRQQRNREWTAFNVDELHGRVLGIAGYGQIGRAAAERARAFGMRIHVLRRHVERAGLDTLVDRAYAPAELGELMAASDYLLVAAPLTAETRGMIDAAALARLRPHAVVINLGRGPVIVEAALIEALREGRIRGAVLDVFDEEPLPPEHPYWTLPNVLLSPHTADHTATWLHEATELFVENYRRYSANEALLNVVDKRLGY